MTEPIKTQNGVATACHPYIIRNAELVIDNSVRQFYLPRIRRLERNLRFAISIELYVRQVGKSFAPVRNALHCS